jgi:Flp pilus assembly protein TadG
MGGAVDIARYTRYKADLSSAVDSAALALARQNPDYTEEQAETFVTNYVNSFGVGDAQFTVQDFAVDKLDNGFLITATGAVQTMFLPLGALTGSNTGTLNSMAVNIQSEVVNGSTRLELALVLDVTGSMNCGATLSSSCTNDWETPSSSSRIVALRSAATTLVNTLMASENNDPDQIKIGVVPFEGTVNIGATYAANPPSWVDWNNAASAYWNGRNFGGYNFTTNTACNIGSAGCSRVGHKWLFNQLTNANSAIKWEGCVEMRNAPYDTLDTTPTTATPDTLFVPFFWPDEPDRYSSSSSDAPYQYVNSGGVDTRYNSNHSSSSWNATSTSSSYNYTYLNNYLQDKSSFSYGSSRPANAQSYVLKYKYTSSSNKATWHTSPSSENQYNLATSFPFASGPNRGCPQAIVPLTGTKSTVINRLSGLVAYPAMGTFIPTGLAWGWHILSPNEPFTEGVAANEQYFDTTLKAMVLFTDGDNSATAYNGNHNNSYFSAYGYLSANRLGTTSSASTANTTLNTKTSSLCTNIKNNNIRLYVISFGSLSSASSTIYHAPSTSALEDIFREIGEDLSDIHLSM